MWNWKACGPPFLEESRALSNRLTSRYGPPRLATAKPPPTPSSSFAAPLRAAAGSAKHCCVRQSAPGNSSGNIVPLSNHILHRSTGYLRKETTD